METTNTTKLQKFARIRGFALTFAVSGAILSYFLIFDREDLSNRITKVETQVVTPCQIGPGKTLTPQSKITCKIALRTLIEETSDNPEQAKRVLGID